MLSREALKRRTAGFSLAYNLVQALVKLVGAVMTGSIALFSEAAHSTIDVASSFVAFLSVRASEVPPDEEHPYGHGKIESVAGFVESTMLIFVTGYVVYEAVHRLISGTRLQNVDVGLWVMGFSVVSSFFVARHVRSVAKQTESRALLSNSQHIMVDFWTSVGVLIALLVTRLTGWAAADAVIAIFVGAWLAFGAYRMAREAFHELIDHALPEPEIARIRAVLDEAEGILSYHKLRTRHSGRVHYIDVHVVVPAHLTVVEAHDLADRLEKTIEFELAPAVAVIHVDPEGVPEPEFALPVEADR